ncbi:MULTISPECIES: Panacea domain-containing protein [unclassified Clostridium]|uniref:Panacea domain-containing protein n=1 Tax=unclassified Clostridium TaxID=2614128 RepID=UPI0025C6BFB4|nr:MULTISPECIES: type II toxin-antitoxin system antitoxin SocA domain-containing protein [unclassified Clostridium]
MYKAIDIAKSFIKDEVVGLDNNYAGNMKINKLLYFAQVVNLVLEDEPLFDDCMFAFENGVVVENVRKEYRDNYRDLVKGAKELVMEFPANVQQTLEITKEIFGSISSRELSDLTHQSEIWKRYYDESIQSGGHYFYNTEKSRIDITKFYDEFKCDLDNVKLMLESHFETNNIEEEDYIEIKNVKFYYNPNQININEELRYELENFPADDNAYSLYMDDKQGLVIY